MKKGDFVNVHFEDGCSIGKLIDDQGDTVTVEFDNSYVKGIPKCLVTLWCSV